MKHCTCGPNEGCTDPCDRNVKSARIVAREEVRKALELHHPELRVGLISEKDALKLACCIEALVEEVLREKLAEPSEDA